MIEQLQEWKARRNATPAELMLSEHQGKAEDSLHIEVVKRVAETQLRPVRNETWQPVQARTANAFTSTSSVTFATEHLRHGIDVRTLQGWMGQDINQRWSTSRGSSRKTRLLR